jgi:propionyl-CoA synthetase
MEEVLTAHSAVSECAVIGRADALKGQVPLGFVTLKSGAEHDHRALEAELIASVRAQIGPVAAFKQVHVVSALPKTRSGKILRKTIRELADGANPIVPATIDDPAPLEVMRELLQR